MTIKYPPSPWVTAECNNCIPFYEAAKSLYEAKKKEAVDILHMYIYHSSELSADVNIMEDIDKWLAILTDSEDKLAALEKHFSTNTRVEDEGDAP